MEQPARRLVVGLGDKHGSPVLGCLKELGYDVVGRATDGASLINLARGASPDAVLADIGLAGVDGIAASRVIAHERLAPVILLGPATTERTAVARVAAAGASAYLPRPATERALLAAIELACGRFSALTALQADRSALRDQLYAERLLLRAKALVMADQGITDEQALRRLHELAQAAGQPVKDVAAAVLLAAKSREHLGAGAS